MNNSELLNRFVARNDIREYLCKPILRDEFLYATNCVIMVRIPVCDGVSYHVVDRPKELAQTLDKNIRGNPPVDIPAFPIGEECKACNGSGIGYRCHDCDGEGSFARFNHTYDCQECGGSGQLDDGPDKDIVPCDNCNGSKIDQSAVPVMIGEAHFDAKYLRLIVDLPNLKFHPAGPAEGAYFTFEGGEGVLMPMRVD